MNIAIGDFRISQIQIQRIATSWSGPSTCCQGAPGSQGQPWPTKPWAHGTEGVAWKPHKVRGKRPEVRIITREGTESADGEAGEEEDEDYEDHDDYVSGNDVQKRLPKYKPPLAKRNDKIAETMRKMRGRKGEQRGEYKIGTTKGESLTIGREIKNSFIPGTSSSCDPSPHRTKHVWIRARDGKLLWLMHTATLRELWQDMACLADDVPKQCQEYPGIQCCIVQLLIAEGSQIPAAALLRLVQCLAQAECTKAVLSKSYQLGQSATCSNWHWDSSVVLSCWDLVLAKNWNQKRVQNLKLNSDLWLHWRQTNWTICHVSARKQKHSALSKRSNWRKQHGWDMLRPICAPSYWSPMFWSKLTHHVDQLVLIFWF